MSKPEPRYMGGQAVLEGVMMRGAKTWAIAVRDPSGEISVDVREVPGWAERYRNIPIVRGVMGLGESLGLGYKALTWSANQQMPEEEQVSEKAMGWAVGVAVIVFSALFIVLPALAGNSLRHTFRGSFPVVEGLARLALFVAYLLADRDDRATSAASSSTTAPSTSRSPRTRTASSSRPRPRSSSPPRTCAAAPTSCSP